MADVHPYAWTALAAAVAAVAAPLACDSPFVPRSAIEDLRVLGVRATPPEARPGEAVRLDALVVDPKGRPVRYDWFACDPPSEPAAVSPCEDGHRLVDIDALATVPGVRSLGTTTTATYTFETSGALSPDAATTALVLLAARVEGRSVLARKTLRLSRSPTPNRNPELELLVIKGGQVIGDRFLTDDAEAEVPCSAIVTATSAESYVRARPDGSSANAIEDLRYEWFATHGSFGLGLRPPSVKPIVELLIDTGIKPPRDAAPEEGGGESSKDEFGFKVTLVLPERNERPEDGWVRVFVVVRDGRGGIDWGQGRIFVFE